MIDNQIGRRLRLKIVTVGILAIPFTFVAANAAPDVATVNGVLLPPVTSPCISSPFGPRVLPNRPLAGTFHTGIDLPAPIGGPVVAVAPGTIIRIQRHGIGGLEILIQHEGFVGIYSHLGMVVPRLASGGRTVYGGQRIATVGHTGLTFGPHLYFGMMVNGEFVDPAPPLHLSPCGIRGYTSQDPRLRPTQIFARPFRDASLGDSR